MLRFLLLLALAATATADPARIHVFVSLADNRTQGIQPVPARIGDGDRSDTNLYWGCDEALKPMLKASGDWKLVSSVAGPKPEVYRARHILASQREMDAHRRRLPWLRDSHVHH